MITYYEQIVLMRAQEEVLIFTWNTVGVQPGVNCTINGEDGTVPARSTHTMTPSQMSHSIYICYARASS